MDAKPQKFSAEILSPVCIRVFNNRPAAEIAAAKLAANDIACWISADDCGGLMPIMAGGGVKLYIHPDSMKTASELLEFESADPNEDKKVLPVGEPPHDHPKFIIVIGIWIICGAGLAGNLYSFRALYLSSINGLHRFLMFWFLAGFTALCTFMLYRSVKNYFIQKKRAKEWQLN